MAIAAICGFVALASAPAGAVHDLHFQLDGNTSATSYPGGSTADQPYDWESFFNGSGAGGTGAPIPGSLTAGFVATGFKADFALPDSSTYATGSKDTLPISGWQCGKSNNVGDKVDIVNAYSAAFRDPASGHLILYFGMEKSSPNGDSNIGMWFLKDGTVDCNATTGGNKTFTGAHQDGDLLVVSSFTNGGGTATVQAFRWQGGASGSLNTTPATTGGKCPASAATPDPTDPATGLPAAACATVNSSAISPPWAHPDKDGGDLNALEFFEGGVDLTALHDEQCFARFLGDTRSSQSPTATIFDFAAGSLPVCGTLHVNKYIDANVNGVRDTSENVAGADRGGWSFKVTGPNGSSAVICSGTTDTNGDLVCSTGTLQNIPVGRYVITETQKTGFFNTDPGSGSTTDRVNTAATVSKSVTVSSGDMTVLFGNTCFVDKTFRITGVPAGTTGMFAHYSVTAGHDVGKTGSVALAVSGTTATGTLNDALVQTDTLDWSFGINNDLTHTVVGQAGESLASFGYPTCAATNTAPFPLARLSGTKYKDVDSSGTRNAGDLPGAGFTFQLLRGGTGGTVLQTTTSDASGNYSFTGVAPGTYAVHELPVTGWVQTEPTSGDQPVTVTFGDIARTIGAFGNTPLSNISVTFGNQAVNPGTSTPATKATITCDDGKGSQTGSTYSTSGVHIGTYQCTVTITDP